MENRITGGKEELVGWSVPIGAELTSSQVAKVEKRVAKLLQTWDSNWINEELTLRIMSDEAQEMSQKLAMLESSLAFEEIRRVLESEDPDKSNVAGCVIFMLEKYGTLYSKDMAPYNNSTFKWYQAMGWDSWDANYITQQWLANQYNYVLSEEALILWMVRPIQEEKIKSDALAREVYSKLDATESSNFSL
jgi:hypothetical protein